VLFLAVLAGGQARAQVGQIGWNFKYSGDVNPPATQTALSRATSSTDGVVGNVTFGWSATNCRAAAKVKFFHPSADGTSWSLSDERGPFDVDSPLRLAGSAPPTTPPVLQTVRLQPPVHVLRGDAIAITNVTPCGGPTWADPLIAPPPPLPPPVATLTYSGDRGGLLQASDGVTSAAFVLVYGTVLGSRLDLVNDGVHTGRFSVELTATDPRTGKSTTGTIHPLGAPVSSGYFSLPEFTGDLDVPEITVKMVDATSAPPPFGGAFWFFYSSLTDVTFTLTVTDVSTGRVRTYGSAGSPAFCGAGDTNAFPP